MATAATDGIRNYVVAGGGSAGWIAAAVLTRFLSEQCTVTVVESEEIGTVGVGEATIPQIRLLNQGLGIDEAAFMTATKATFKLGIAFEGWSTSGESYIHAFGNIGRGLGLLPFHHYWLRARGEGSNASLWDFSPCAQAAWQGCSPIARTQAPAQATQAAQGNAQASLAPALASAYHFDAALYAGYLRRYSEERGVRRVEGKIAEVALHDETSAEDSPNSAGTIRALKLEDGREISGDFFIDCTGFRGLLIGGALDSEYQDWTRWLPCDRAIALPCAVDTTAPPTPYTRAIAHTAGWQWRIPLQHRIGNGYVYCSRYINDEQAQATLTANLEGEAQAEPRLLRFTTGFRPQSWRGNCLALGLAAGFMEPLESTSIHLIQAAIGRFMRFLPKAAVVTEDVDEYNRKTLFEWESIRDFLILHYYQNQRTEPFWKDCQHIDIPATLQRKIALFQANGRIFREQEELFTEVGWLQVMIGQGLHPADWHPLADNVTKEQLAEFLDLAQRDTQNNVRRLYPHAEIINRYNRSQSSTQNPASQSSR